MEGRGPSTMQLRGKCFLFFTSPTVFGILGSQFKGQFEGQFEGSSCSTVAAPAHGHGVFSVVGESAPFFKIFFVYMPVVPGADLGSALS